MDYKVAMAESGTRLSEVPPASDTEPARSRDRILELLLKSEKPLPVQALAAALAISRNATHQHVMALEREGLVERAMAIPTKGRPSQGFQLSAAGKATFPRQYALLARQFLAELTRHVPAAQLHRSMERIGRSLAASLADKAGPNADPAVIAGLMRELGYQSSVVEGEDGPEIEAHNCVFHDLAMANSAVCEVDLSLLRALSGKDVDHRRCMALGGSSCRFAFQSPKSPGSNP